LGPRAGELVGRAGNKTPANATLTTPPLSRIFPAPLASGAKGRRFESCRACFEMPRSLLAPSSESGWLPASESGHHGLAFASRHAGPWRCAQVPSSSRRRCSSAATPAASDSMQTFARRVISTTPSGHILIVSSSPSTPGIETTVDGPPGPRAPVARSAWRPQRDAQVRPHPASCRSARPDPMDGVAASQGRGVR
jgi:hypothetical protein